MYQNLSMGCDGKYQRPTINTDHFPNTKFASYWSASPDASNGSKAWRLRFYNGYDSYYSRSDSNHVRLVRSGQ